MYRLFLNILVLLSVFFFPAYISALFLIALIFLLNNFFEAIFWAYVIDILYGAGSSLVFGFNYVFLILIIVIFLASFRIKKTLVFYPRI